MAHFEKLVVNSLFFPDGEIGVVNEHLASIVRGMNAVVNDARACNL